MILTTIACPQCLQMYKTLSYFDMEYFELKDGFSKMTTKKKWITNVMLVVVTNLVTIV